MSFKNVNKIQPGISETALAETLTDRRTQGDGRTACKHTGFGTFNNAGIKMNKPVQIKIHWNPNIMRPVTMLFQIQCCFLALLTCQSAKLIT